MDNYKILDKPLTDEECKAIEDEDGYISGVVAIDLDDVISFNFETIMDILSERLVNSGILGDISYEVVGFDKSELHIKVEGIPEYIEDM